MTYLFNCLLCAKFSPKYIVFVIPLIFPQMPKVHSYNYFLDEESVALGSLSSRSEVMQPVSY